MIDYRPSSVCLLTYLLISLIVHFYVRHYGRDASRPAGLSAAAESCSWNMGIGFEWLYFQQNIANNPGFSLRKLAVQLVSNYTHITEAASAAAAGCLAGCPSRMKQTGLDSKKQRSNHVSHIIVYNLIPTDLTSSELIRYLLCSDRSQPRRTGSLNGALNVNKVRSNEVSELRWDQVRIRWDETSDAFLMPWFHVKLLHAISVQFLQSARILDVDSSAIVASDTLQ